jgi:choline kinase
MQAVILAAGVGERMGAATAGLPKCLLEIDGSSLLARHLAVLHGHGISDISIVTGYRADRVAAEALRSGGATTIYNPDYRAGSIVSLWSARGPLAAGDDVLLMDADVLYHPRVLTGLLRGERRNCFLIDREFEAGEEPVKVCLRHGRIVEFRKRTDVDLAFDAQGESVGFFRFTPVHARRLADISARFIDAGRTAEPYEEAIRELVLAEPADFAVEDITGLPWIELDFPADLNRAHSEILPRIRELPN